MKRKIALLSVLWVLIGAVWILGLNWPRLIGAADAVDPGSRASGEGTGVIYALNEAEAAEEAPADRQIPETASAAEEAAGPASEPPADAPVVSDAPDVSDSADGGSGETTVYVLNTNTKKIHLPDCKSVADIKEKNRGECTDPDEALADGYEWCKRCHG